MSTLQSIVDMYKTVATGLPETCLGAGQVQAVTGKIITNDALDRQALQDRIDQFNATGGWLQYQGQVVRPQDFDFADGVPVEHPDWGLLLDAELFGAGDQQTSLIVRFTGESWQAAEWQAGDGEPFLAETVKRRSLGGAAMTYLRLWQEKDHELQAVSAWLVNTSPANQGDSND